MNLRPILIHSFLALNFLPGLVGTVQAVGNTIYGTGAGASLTTGSNNTLIGENAGAAITNTSDNTLIGNQAGQFTTGSGNTMVGNLAGWGTTTGVDNLFFGAGAGAFTTTGCCNTYLGRFAGFLNQTGLGNVFVGESTGYHELGSHKLYIANSDTTAPLIYGEFDNDLVGINGALGVGTQIPLAKLHVRDGNLRIEQTGAAHATLNFIANGQTWEIKNNQATGRLTFFSPGGGATTASFKFDRQATENLLRVGVLAADTVDVNGNLIVTGSINPDFVFTPEYPLETIEAHAASMWAHRHLPAVGQGQVNAYGQAMVNVGARSQGMLEELEIAHIYIEQLHGEKTQTEAELAALQADQAHKGDQLAVLTKEVTALKATEVDLAALKSQMAEKAAQLATLEDELAALETQVQHLVGQIRDRIPGEEG